MSESQIRPEDCATVWFSRLERAKEHSDFEAAWEALQQLKRLGVVVTFETPKKRETSHVS